MRPNKVGWIIASFFLVGGLAFWATMPEIFIGQIWIAVSLALILYYALMNRAANRADDLRRTGVRGQAEILEMTQTGTYINNQPRVKLKLRILAPHVAPFEDERTVTVPMIALGRLTAGTPLNVYMPPEDPKSYVIDWSGGGGGEGGAPITVHQQGGAALSVAQNAAAGEAVMEALREHGIDPSSGNVDLRQLPAAREAVLRALREHGVDAAHQVAAESPATPIEDSGEPMERLLKLQQLKDADLITAAEYDEQRRRIIENL